MARFLINDCLTAIPGTRTFWHDLKDWFGCEFIGGEFSQLCVSTEVKASLIIRNGTWFGPLSASEKIPTISLIQDIMEDGPQREMQGKVIDSSRAVVFNSRYTASKYGRINRNLESKDGEVKIQQQDWVIPLPVDFSLFEPGNAMGLQQALGLPDGAVCWIGSQHPIKGYDIFIQIVRANPDIPFVAMFKDALPAYCPPNMRMYCRLPHEELVKVIGACRVGLCTSRMESQHLAGIEMGACGLPMVAPPVGVYYQREFPGISVSFPTLESYSEGIRKALFGHCIGVREYWQKEFDKPVIRKQWEALVQEVECSGAF